MSDQIHDLSPVIGIERLRDIDWEILGDWEIERYRLGLRNIEWRGGKSVFYF